MSTQPEAATTEAATAPEPMIDNIGYEVFIAALSILSIVNLVLIFLVTDESLEFVLQTMNLILSIILFFDFLYRMRKAPSKSTYFFREFGWADLGASLPLPQLKILRVFRLIKVWRLFRLYGAKRLVTALVKERAETALFLLLLIAVLVLESTNKLISSPKTTWPGLAATKRDVCGVIARFLIDRKSVV